uniref:BZIP domain-containing protein n=1 Tax=Bracon brevicornis TaxID=1563983 RepID=A0A6V7M8F6_9HYME
MASYQLNSSEQALDFTTSATDPSESPILDLSFKKNTPPKSAHNEPNSCTMSPVSDRHSLSPAEQTPLETIPRSFNEENRSPTYEARTYMVTPPSETDSPRKQKYEMIYPQYTYEISHYPLIPMGLPLPPPVHGPIMPTENGATVMPQIPVPVSTTTTNTNNYPTQEAAGSSDSSKKAPRPFKAYPKDPLTLTLGPELVLDQNSNEAYSEFRKRMLESVKKSNEGTNIKMRRVSKSPSLPTSTVDDKDAAYWERRRKNNEAAKRSRDARRAKEDEIAIRAAFLEQENIKLKYELAALRTETAKLRCLVYST